jgi:hypothetical protein
MEAHASQLTLQSSFVEVGSNNSPEQLNHGFNIASVISVNAGDTFSHEAASSFAQKFQNVCLRARGPDESTISPKFLSLLYSGNVSPHCSAVNPVTPLSIRHFVAWKFREDAEACAVKAAVAGYMNLPLEMPYFSSLEVGPEISLNPSYSVCLYSTFRDAQAQEAFVHDSRRIVFKDTFVKPHLALNGVLVFDFLPERT